MLLLSFGRNYSKFQPLLSKFLTFHYCSSVTTITGIYNFGSIYTIVLTREYFTVFYRDIMGTFIPLGNYIHDSGRKCCLCV